MRYNSKSSIDNARNADRNDELDRLVRSINLRISEENKDMGHAEREYQSHLVEHPKAARVIANIIGGAVVGSMLVGFGVAAKDIGISVYKSVQRAKEIPVSISEDMKRPDQAKGIVATTGMKTNNVFGTIYLNSADGTSYYYKDGKRVPDYVPEAHRFSIDLDTYVKVVSSDRDRTLLVQNILAVKRSFPEGIVYFDTSEVYKLPSASIINAVEKGAVDAFTKQLPLYNPTGNMNGKGYQGYYGKRPWDVYYVYNMPPRWANFPVGTGLDITAKKEGDDVVIKFGQFPAERGMLYGEKMHVFDMVTYHVTGLEKVYMVFNDVDSTGLTISGYGSNDVLRAKNLNGVLNLYEMVHDKREPLMIGSTREWTLSGGASNVLAEVKGNSVIITTAPKKSK